MRAASPHLSGDSCRQVNGDGGEESLVGGQHQGAGGRKGASRAVDQACLGVRHLPVAAFTPQLPCSFQQKEHPIHAGVAVGETSSVGVHGEIAAGSRALVGNEVGALAPAAEAERLQRDEDCIGEGVIDHGEVYVIE